MGPLPGGFTFDLDGRAAAGYALAVALALFAALGVVIALGLRPAPVESAAAVCPVNEA